MELVEGRTLADRIADGAIPIEEALPIATQIAEAFEAAHERGIVHRDLKPANVKVREDGTVKVLDFGLAKAMEAAPGTQGSPTVSPSMLPTMTSPALVTGAGMLLGTAAYMSPEQAKGRPADKRSDVWAFGAVLYEMLSGERAFTGEDMVDVLGAVARLDPDWTKLPATTPAPVRLLIQQCLSKERKTRLGDIAGALFSVNKRGLPPATLATCIAGSRRTDHRRRPHGNRARRNSSCREPEPRPGSREHRPSARGLDRPRRDGRAGNGNLS
jgi:serine/threonine protein kinase